CASCDSKTASPPSPLTSQSLQSLAPQHPTPPLRTQTYNPDRSASIVFQNQQNPRLHFPPPTKTPASSTTSPQTHGCTVRSGSNNSRSRAGSQLPNRDKATPSNQRASRCSTVACRRRSILRRLLCRR